MSQVLTGPIQFTSRIPLLLHAASRQWSVHKHVTSANKCFRNRSLSLRVSVLFHPFITCAAGETTLYCILLFLHGRGNVLVCNCTAWEKIKKKGGESQCVRGFWRLIPVSIFWCARWITSRVWLHAVRLLHQLMFPPHRLPDGETPKILETSMLIVVQQVC